MADRSMQGARARMNRLSRMDAEFYGRKFDIEKTIVLPPGQVFYAFNGRPCRKGYVIRDRETGKRLAVGFLMLKQIHDRYQAVSLPGRVKPKADSLSTRPEPEAS